MIKIIDTQELTDANKFGEELRDFVFVKKNKNDYGCYSTFKLLPQFKKVNKFTNLGEEMLRLLGWKPEVKDTYGANKYIEDKANIFTNGYITVAWCWDGDGTLIIREGDKTVINTDCKKDHVWKWV